MKTLSAELEMTAPASTLLKKACRLGVADLDAALALAINRGCLHYSGLKKEGIQDPGRNALPEEELVILLLLGKHRYEPMAIRCAGQLLRSKHLDFKKLVKLARQENTSRVLAHIARAGVAHDKEAGDFWERLLDQLGEPATRMEPKLPHWSRFVSMPGFRPGQDPEITWLVPTRDAS